MTLSTPIPEHKTPIQALENAHAKIKEILFDLAETINAHNAYFDARSNPKNVNYDPRFDPRNPAYDSTFAAGYPAGGPASSYDAALAKGYVNPRNPIVPVVSAANDPRLDPNSPRYDATFTAGVTPRGQFPAGDPRNVASHDARLGIPAGNVDLRTYPAGDPRIVPVPTTSPNSPNSPKAGGYDARFDSASTSYDARLDPKSPKYDAAFAAKFK